MNLLATAGKTESLVKYKGGSIVQNNGQGPWRAKGGQHIDYTEAAVTAARRVIPSA